MNARSYEAVNQMDLASLGRRCSDEIQRFRRKEAFDDQYCLEIFRRAILQRVELAWALLQQRFDETVRIWLRSHPSYELALHRDSEENYVALTFSRFWYAVREQQIDFPTLYAALSYLHGTLNGLLIDMLRSRALAREVALPEANSAQEPSFVQEINDEQSMWQSLQEFLQNPRERRLMYLLYYCGFKPREVAARWPQEFQSVKEIYNMNHTVLERLRRNRDRLRWLLGDGEV